MPKTSPTRPGVRRRSREEIKQALARTLRREFPQDTVDISDGYKDNIHVLVVLRRFDEMSEKGKQSLLWRLIDETDLRPTEKALVSLVYPVSPAELK